MGYILPIHHEQYTQYANRVIPVKHQYQKLTKVRKPKVEKKLNNPDKPFEFTKERDMVDRQAKARRSAYTREKVEEMFSQLTGKGRLINEVI
ncbi:MAG TPA: hypothetical protein VNM45_19385 [Bacillus sp. (in: firmicutes)]|nr:hypothetical protein [Bacillus sp. (in: firmicutes)]